MNTDWFYLASAYILRSALGLYDNLLLIYKSSCWSFSRSMFNKIIWELSIYRAWHILFNLWFSNSYYIQINFYLIQQNMKIWKLSKFFWREQILRWKSERDLLLNRFYNLKYSIFLNLQSYFDYFYYFVH